MSAEPIIFRNPYEILRPQGVRAFWVQETSNSCGAYFGIDEWSITVAFQRIPEPVRLIGQHIKIFGHSFDWEILAVHAPYVWVIPVDSHARPRSVHLRDIASA